MSRSSFATTLQWCVASICVPKYWLFVWTFCAKFTFQSAISSLQSSKLLVQSVCESSHEAIAVFSKQFLIQVDAFQVNVEPLNFLWTQESSLLSPFIITQFTRSFLLNYSNFLVSKHQPYPKISCLSLHLIISNPIAQPQFHYFFISYSHEKLRFCASVS